MICTVLHNLVSRILVPYKLIYAEMHNLIYVKPDYWVVNRFNKNSAIIDIGLGNDADFSQNMIARYHLRSYGFDPTRRHYSSLNKVRGRLSPNFSYFPIALAHRSGKITFFETLDNVSGSFSSEHTNMLHDRTKSYKVKALTISEIISLTELKHVDLLKIDIEGEEYEVVKELSPKDTRNVDQLIIEFHHLTIRGRSISQTKELIKHIKNLGFANVFSIDNVNFLFYR